MGLPVARHSPLLAQLNFPVTRAGYDGQARILREARIAGRKLAEKEHRAALGLDAARMNAIQTQPGLGLISLALGIRHFLRIAHCVSSRPQASAHK
jgi:hypothetical protein